MSFVLLLAPSEEKIPNISIQSLEGKDPEVIFNFLQDLYLPKDMDSSTSEMLFKHRVNVYKEFLDEVRVCIFNQDLKLLKKLTSKTSFNDNAMDELVGSLNLSLQKAILLYKGVAFKAIDYESLPKPSQEYIDSHVLIFSNLFGIVRASDKLPYYKLTQNASLLKKVYKPYLSLELDYDFIVDLRAGVYKNLIKTKGVLIDFNFYKDSKPVSHYSKHFRGLLLRLLSLEDITSLSSLDAFLTSLDSNLCFLDKKEEEKKIVYNFKV
ncbi:peroxide stress protein YaaA [Helicobacter sp. 11S02629-2]|uniref:peroxide stress protein YaaA n=1 Tax=Helicobacter sp. 11S02629-2 TaxID=1476195 RepID=UPI000BDC502D|nr:peroxide stress protein YaaA [Helicobacter sp. 11S02629-2]PAF44966.1 hypothetical protein BKH40_04575 [Helicobacter sp. 11S02629-2]